MKIAMIGHKRIPSREGGVEIVVEELSTRMVEKGHTVEVYNRRGHHVSGRENDRAKLKVYGGIRIITIPTFQNKSLNAVVYSILATIRALFGRYNVIHFHASGSCAMLWLPKLFGIHTVATIHGLDSKRSKWGGFASKYLQFGERMAAKKADELIVLSENVKNYFKEKFDRDATYIPNGITKPVRYKADRITSQFGLKKDEYILFLARIVPEKGLHYLIEAFKAIETDKKLCIVGGASHSDAYLEEVMKSVDGVDRICMTGFQQGRVLEELFSNAYCYVLPSDVEGMPLSLLEAMSYGNCCLVSDIPENVEVVCEYAVHFKRGNIKDLREKLKELIQNPERVNIYKKNASEFVLHKYNWDNIVEKTLKLYERREKNENINGQ